MANPHPKPGPGRPKGSLNKATLEARRLAAETVARLLAERRPKLDIDEMMRRADDGTFHMEE